MAYRPFKRGHAPFPRAGSANQRQARKPLSMSSIRVRRRHGVPLTQTLSLAAADPLGHETTLAVQLVDEPVWAQLARQVAVLAAVIFIALLRIGNQVSESPRPATSHGFAVNETRQSCSHTKKKKKKTVKLSRSSINCTVNYWKKTANLRAPKPVRWRNSPCWQRTNVRASGARDIYRNRAFIGSAYWCYCRTLIGGTLLLFRPANSLTAIEMAQCDYSKCVSCGTPFIYLPGSASIQIRKVGDVVVFALRHQLE